MAEDLGFTLDPYYDDNAGNNFAVDGARTESKNSNNDDIAVFLPGLSAFENSLGDNHADSDALYLV